MYRIARLCRSSSASETPETNFETSVSAAEFARQYRDDALPGGHVIMLSPDDASRAAARAALAAYPQGLHVGGGITAESAGAYLDAGASHVIVTSYVFRDGAVDETRLAALVRASLRACAAFSRAASVCGLRKGNRGGVATCGGDDKMTL